MKLDILKHRGVGYKGQLNLVYSSTGARSDPVLRTRYEDYLYSLNQKFNSWVSTTFVKDKVEGLSDALDLMQQQYPGNYTLVEVYNSTRGAFELAVKFENPKEEMLWKMKWT